MTDVGKWLQDLGFERFVDLFEENEIDCEVLFELTDEDLAGLNIPLGARKKLLKAIKTLASSSTGEAHRPTNDWPAPPASDLATLRASAERRHLTVMFVDLVSSTEMSARLDPEDMREVITRYQNSVAGGVTRFSGHVAKYMGDGVLCYFGWPRAHETDAERAVHAGLAIAEAMSDMTAPNGETIRARIGIATGLVVIGDLIGEGAAQEEAVIGDTPNLASRLQDLAKPGQTVISATTQELVADHFLAHSMGLQRLKGISEPVEAFVVTEGLALESRFAARSAKGVLPLIGREQELALLLERWRQAKAGEGQLVLLTGEAGIGKSRILRAAVDAITAEPHVRISYQCSPYHSDSALFPAIQQLGRAARINANDGPDTKLDKLEALLAQASDRVDDEAPLIAALLGIEAEGRYGPLALSPPQQRAKTFQVLLNQLFGLARSGPVLFLLEDAHWIDPTTLELLELTLSRCENTPVLIVVTARPAFDHAIVSHPVATRLALNRLGRDQSLAIVARLSGGKHLPQTVLDEIVTRTDGVPLFVEELTKTLLESGMLEETATAFELVGALDQLEIPTSLHDSLMARLDRLQPVKEVAQMASCIGRDFSHQLLAALSPLSVEGLQEALDNLIEAELLFRRGTAPDLTYTFKHALVRDAAYESLLKSKRQALHAGLVDALKGDETTAPEILAHHATEAGLREVAVDNWLLAGRLANDRSAFSEAIAHLGNGLRVLAAEPDAPASWRRELEIRAAMGVAVISSKGYGASEVEDNFERVLSLSERLDDRSRRFVALYGLWWFRFVAQDVKQSRETASELLATAAEQNQNELLIPAHRALGYTEWMLGEFQAGLSAHEIGTVIYNPELHGSLAARYGGADPGVGLWTLGANCLWYLGWPDRSMQCADRSLAMALELDHPLSECWARTTLAQAHQLCRASEDVRIQTERALALARELSFPLYVGWATSLLGWSMINAGDGGDATPVIREGIGLSDATGTIVLGTVWRGLLAEAFLQAGDYAAGLAALDEARLLADRNNERLWAAELLRLRGVLHMAQNCEQVPFAEQCFRDAICTAQAQNAKSWELRAATSLSRLWAERGERQKALDLLTPLYGWFTEGFETPDLKDAKALLDQLL